MSISPIILADAPAIAGLSFRHVRGVKDADALCRAGETHGPRQD